MALFLGKFNGGTTRAKLSAVLGTSEKSFRQFTIYADAGNTGSVYIGPSTVTSVPANERLKLAAGVSMNLGPQSGDRPFVVDTEEWYVVGSAAGQVLFIQDVTDDGR
jgi:hypothetical protein